MSDIRAEENIGELYSEEPWASRGLFQVETFEDIISDPMCGRGNIVEAGIGAGYRMYQSDITDRGQHTTPVNFFAIQDFNVRYPGVKTIVTNPPFVLAPMTLQHGLHFVDTIAMFLPSRWFQTWGRNSWLRKTPLARVWWLTPRPKILRGDDTDTKKCEDYAWGVWRRKHEGVPTLGWISRTDV